MSVKSFIKKIAGGQEETKPATPKKKARAAKAVPTATAPEPKREAGPSMPVSKDLRLTPLITEKSVQRQMSNQVAFRVVAGASKQDIARAVWERYGVKALRVRTVTVGPKRRQRGQTIGQTPRWKKAYVLVEDIKSFNVAP
jgi:large subunit ribosomal protein L23